VGTSRFSPRSLLVAGFVLWFLIRVSIAYIDFEVPYTAVAVLLIVGYVVAFLVGTFFADLRSMLSRLKSGATTAASVDAATIRAYRGATVALQLIAFVFLVLRFYDLIYVRGFLDAGGIQEFRIIENTVIGTERETGGISFISGIGYPLAVPTLILTTLLQNYLKRWQLWSGGVLFVVYAAYVVASGNRYALIGPLTLWIIAVALLKGGIRMSPRSILVYVALAIGGFIYFVYGHQQRDVLYGVDRPLQALQVAPVRKLYAPSPGFMAWFEGQPDIAQRALYGWIELAWYNTHGMYEFQKTVNYADPDDPSWGAAQFATALYFFRTLGISTPGEETWRRNLPTYGFYSTFFGPVYLDFGVGWGLVYCGLFGFLTQLVWNLARVGRISGVMLYPFAGSVVLNMPANNLIVAGLGVPILGTTLFAVVLVTAWVRLVAPKRGRALSPPVRSWGPQRMNP
jgi:hypothetical protein